MSGRPGPGLRLPVRVEPVSGESFAGFMLRTAEANRYPEPKWLIPPGMHGPALVNPRDPALILGWLGHGAEAAEKVGSVRVERFRTRIGAGSTIWTAAADLRRPKVCPACIRKRGIMRSVWDLRYYTACAEHGCRMLHCCPRCGRQIDWKRSRLDRCCPDAGFGEAEVELAPAWTVGLMRTIEVASGTMAAADDGGFGGLVAGMGLSDLLSLIRTLAAASAPDRAVSKIVSDTAPDRAAAAAHADAAAAVLAGWPDSLHAIIRRQASRSGDIGSTEMRKVFPILADAGKQPAFAFLGREFKSFVSNQYTDWIRTPQRRALVAEYKDIRADAAAGILGMNAWTVVCRAKGGDIPGRCADIRGQQTWFFSKHEVEEVREREWTHVDAADARKSRGALTLTEAAAMLGLSLPNARKLAAAGLLGPQDVHVHFTRYFDQRRILELIGRMDALMTVGSDPAPAPGDLTSALDLRSMTVRNGIVTLLRTILERSIRSDGEVPDALGLMRFGWTRATRARVEMSLTPAMTRADAARSLGCFVEAVETLVQAGLVTRLPTEAAGSLPSYGKRWRVSAQDVIALTNAYVTSAAISRASGIHLNGVAHRLRERGLVPYFDAGTSSATLWPKSILEDLKTGNEDRRDRQIA
jgi:hypothetical protein